MFRTAGEVLRSLEMRVARLEMEASSDSTATLEKAGFKFVKSGGGSSTFKYKGAEVKFSDTDLSYSDDIKSLIKQLSNIEGYVAAKKGGSISKKDLDLELKNRFGRMKGANLIFSLVDALLARAGVVPSLGKKANLSPVSGVAQDRLFDLLDELPHLDEDDVESMISSFRVLSVREGACWVFLSSSASFVRAST